MLKIKSRTRLNDYVDRVSYEIDLPMDVDTLKKDLYRGERTHEVLCPKCNGTGLKLHNDVFGISQDKNIKSNKPQPLFPYEKQNIVFCDECYFGVITVCNYCGKALGKFKSTCDCDYVKRLEAKRITELRNKTMNKALLVDDPDLLKDVVYFYSEDYFDNDGYFQEWEEFFNKWYEYEEETKHLQGIDRPMYVYLTKPLHFSLDAENIISDGICNEDYYEDAYSDISTEKTKELQELLDKWCKDCGVGITYVIDYSHKTPIPWSEYEKYIEKYCV